MIRWRQKDSTLAEVMKTWRQYQTSLDLERKLKRMEKEVHVGPFIIVVLSNSGFCLLFVYGKIH